MGLLKNIILVGIFFCSTVNAFEDNIEERLSDCMKKNLSTVGMNNCFHSAQIEWDKEMNKYYSLLKEKLTQEEFVILQNAQRDWIRFRDNELKFIKSRYYEHSQGTLWTNIATADELEIVKTRALSLRNYYQILLEQ